MARLFLFALPLMLLSACGDAVDVSGADAGLSGQATADGLAAVASRPVWVGRNEDRRANACTRRMRARGENATVRWAPDAGGPVKATVTGEVLACETDGTWTGVVFPGSGETVDYCALNRRIARPTEYQGPCRSGWVRTSELAG
jgi:hypothetical protein